MARSWAMRSPFQKEGRRKMPLAILYLIWLLMATVMFSSTVSSENRRIFWKVRAMPARLTCAVVMPWISLPSSRMVPWVG